VALNLAYLGTRREQLVEMAAPVRGILALAIAARRRPVEHGLDPPAQARRSGFLDHSGSTIFVTNAVSMLWTGRAPMTGSTNAAPLPEQEIVIAIDRRKAVLRRANNLLADGHDQSDGGIDLVLR
jgi:hypothetical protein